MAFVGLLAWGSAAFYSAIQLTPPTATEEWFDIQHMMAGAADRLAKSYLSGQDNNYQNVRFVFGLEEENQGLKREYCSGSQDSEVDGCFSVYNPDINRGKAVFDKKFTLHSDKAQLQFIDFCDDIASATRDCDGSKPPEGCPRIDRLVQRDSLKCWVREFRVWHQDKYNGKLPVVEPGTHLETAAEFDERLKQYALTNSTCQECLKYVNGVFKFSILRATTMLSRRESVQTKVAVYDEIDKIIQKYNSNAPADGGTLFCDGGRGWVWMRTEIALVKGLFDGLSLCFPVTFGVLLFATGNLLVSTYATFSIACIVASVLGFVGMLGWDLGVAESIAGIIVVGFSVDYVVHLGHMYTESSHTVNAVHPTDKFKFATSKMGGTVLAGAITTAGSGAIMFVCQIMFFYKMAVLISLTISFSFLYSLGFFMSACILIGPHGNFGSLKALFQKKVSVEPRLEDWNKRLTSKTEILFNRYSVSSAGELSSADIEKMYVSLALNGEEAKGADVPNSSRIAQAILEEFDDNGDGKVDIQEFTSHVVAKVKERKVNKAKGAIRACSDAVDIVRFFLVAEKALDSIETQLTV